VIFSTEKVCRRSLLTNFSGQESKEKATKTFAGGQKGLGRFD
jgi:hypothetical protein